MNSWRAVLAPAVALLSVAACSGAPPSAQAPPESNRSEPWPPPTPGVFAPPSQAVGPLFTIDAVERSVARSRGNAPSQVSPLQASGLHHALSRIEQGVVLVGETEGVVGFLGTPVPGAGVDWAGFVDNDAVLVATRGELYRAESAAAAVAGTFQRVGALPTGVRSLASAGKWVVAASLFDDRLFFVSKDAGRKFEPAKRPGGMLADVAVRGDGTMVAAIDTAASPSAPPNLHYGTLHVHRAGATAWTAGPVAQVPNGVPLLAVTGDAIVATAQGEGGDFRKTHVVGLDAHGAWVPTDVTGYWLDAFAFAGFDIHPPPPRPGYPKAVASGAAPAAFGMLGGRLGPPRERCEGVMSLRSDVHPFFPGVNRVRAFNDGGCAPSDVETAPASGSAPAYPRCRSDAPAAHPPTLLIAGPGSARVVRLPPTCPHGRVLSTDYAAFVLCSGTHRGHAAVLELGAQDAFAEVFGDPRALLASDPSKLLIESATDGTTVLSAPGFALVCGAAAPCVAVSGDDLLRARPLAKRRALVARRGGNDHQLVLEVVGEARTPVQVAVNPYLLEIAVDDAGYVVLWTSVKMAYLPFVLPPSGPPRDVDAFLVGSNGSLYPAPAAPGK
jgi:hypothetical protein